MRIFNNTDPDDVKLLGNFLNLVGKTCSDPLSPNSADLNITNFFRPNLLLGESTDAKPISLGIKSKDEAPVKKNLILTYQCKDQWAISQDILDKNGVPTGDTEPLEFITFSQEIGVGMIQGYSVLTFYTGVILIMGMYLRPVFIFWSNRAFIYEMTYPDPMLRLCESVHLMRHQENLKEEEVNYRTLVEILRSPELLKSLTGSYARGGTFAPSDSEAVALEIPKAFK